MALAIYHLAVKSVSRKVGRSAPAAAAYRAGEVIVNERDGLVHDYRARGGVQETFIVTPAGAEWALDRSVLWNAAEAAEKRKDAKVAREYELALPAELTKGQRLALVREFAEAVCERFEVAVDVAIHAPHDYGDDRNHHAHVLTTTRAVKAQGLGAKTRQLDVSSTASIEIEAIRALWERQANAALEVAGVAARIDARSLAAQGVERLPTMHMGPAASALERRGVRTRRGDHNRAVANDNEAEARLTAEIVDLRAERDRRARSEAEHEAVPAPAAAPTAPGRGIEADRRREVVREPERAATAAPGYVLTDAAYALASSQQDYEALAVMKALTQFFEKLRPVAEVSTKAAVHPEAWEQRAARREREIADRRARDEATVRAYQAVYTPNYYQAVARKERAERFGNGLLMAHQRKLEDHRARKPVAPTGVLAKFRHASHEAAKARWREIAEPIKKRIVRLTGQLAALEGNSGEEFIRRAAEPRTEKATGISPAEYRSALSSIRREDDHRQAQEAVSAAGQVEVTVPEITRPRSRGR